MEEMEVYEQDGKKPDYLSMFLVIVAVVLLLFGFGYQNLILGAIGVMAFVLVALKFLWKKVKGNWGNKMEGETQEDQTTYRLTIYYLEERDEEIIEQLTKNNVKQIVNSLKTQIEQKKEFATIEVDEKDFYIFRLLNIKNIESVEVNEEW